MEARVENFQVKTIVTEAMGWTGHAAGQHVDIRLTAPDGYQAQRSYSIANAPGDGQRVGITVQRVDNGEVSRSFWTNSESGTRLSCEARLAAISPGSLATVGPSAPRRRLRRRAADVHVAGPGES